MLWNYIHPLFQEAQSLPGMYFPFSFQRTFARSPGRISQHGDSIIVKRTEVTCPHLATGDALNQILILMLNTY